MFLCRTLCYNSHTVLLEEMESTYHDVLLHCSVRWLSCGKILLRFVECLIEIRVFFRGQGKADPELEDEKWLVKLMFLADITTHLNELNLHLQGAGKTVMCLFEVCKGFASKLDVYTRDIRIATFRYFEHLKAFSVDYQVNSVKIDMYIGVQRLNFAPDFKIFNILVHWFLFSSSPRAAKT